jgi:hypothetical protein
MFPALLPVLITSLPSQEQLCDELDAQLQHLPKKRRMPREQQPPPQQQQQQPLQQEEETAACMEVDRGSGGSSSMQAPPLEELRAAARAAWKRAQQQRAGERSLRGGCEQGGSARYQLPACRGDWCWVAGVVALLSGQVSPHITKPCIVNEQQRSTPHMQARPPPASSALGDITVRAAGNIL